jgi:hypothetical protein
MEPIVFVLGGIITIVGVLLLMAIWSLIRRPRQR